MPGLREGPGRTAKQSSGEPWAVRETLEGYCPSKESSLVTATDRSTELITVAAQAAADKLAHDIIAYDVSDVLSITDAFLLASAPNDRQVKSIVDEIEERLNKELGAKPVRREGDREARWVLLDYVDIVVHVQHSEERVFYALERLWKDCPEIALPEDAKATRGKGAEYAERQQAAEEAGVLRDLGGELR
nr:ribosome silencing factor [Streptomyces typhae]